MRIVVNPVAEKSSYSLGDLAHRSGFTERQVRAYLAEVLQCKAERAGRGATYAQETLNRLLLLAKYKGARMEPTNRPLTLEEIARAVNALDDAGVVAALADPQPARFVEMLMPSATGGQHAPRPRGAASTEVAELLGRLGRLLADASPANAPDGDAERPSSARAPGAPRHWARLESDGLEILVRLPRNGGERAQAARRAAEIHELLKH